MRRQKIITIVLLVAFAIMLCAYFFILKPYIASNTEAPVETAPETEEGESLGVGNRIFMFENIETKDIKKIKIDNEHGGFAFVRNEKNEFKIEGYEKLPYDEELFAQLTSITSYTLSRHKVMSNPSQEKLAEYGLDAPMASWTVYLNDGREYTVYVGDRLLTEGGYYCMMKGRNTVYVLSDQIDKTVLTKIEGYITPIIAAGISQNDYYSVDKFTVYQNGEKLFRIRLVDKNNQNNPDALAENIMDYPTSYYPNSSLYYEVIYQFMGLLADSCYDIDATDDEKAAVGLLDPAHVITYEYNDTLYEIYFSKKNSDGTYYAMNNMYPNVIGIISGDELGYLEYPLINWIDSYIYQEYITNIGEITLNANGTETIFTLKHKYVEGENNPELSVYLNGKLLPAERSENFRQFYKTMLGITIEDYILNDEYCKMTSETEINSFLADSANSNLSLTYTTVKGESQTLSFYPYSTRHSAVTIDGEGEFYVLSDFVNKIINDIEKIERGELVDSNTKY